MISPRPWRELRADRQTISVAYDPYRKHMRTTSIQRSRAATVRRAATSLAARARTERRGDLSLNQTAVLGRLAMVGPITPGEMAAQLRTMPQSLTRTYAALERSGYLVRTPDPDDGRQALLELTRAGLAALKAEMAPRDAWLARAMAEMLTEKEQEELDERSATDGTSHRLRARRCDGGAMTAALEVRTGDEHTEASADAVPLRRIAGLFAPYRWQVAGTGRGRDGAGGGRRGRAVPDARDHRPGAARAQRVAGQLAGRRHARHRGLAAVSAW